MKLTYASWASVQSAACNPVKPVLCQYCTLYGLLSVDAVKIHRFSQACNLEKCHLMLNGMIMQICIKTQQLRLQSQALIQAYGGAKKFVNPLKFCEYFTQNVICASFKLEPNKVGK